MYIISLASRSITKGQQCTISLLHKLLFLKGLNSGIAPHFNNAHLGLLYADLVSDSSAFSYLNAFLCICRSLIHTFTMSHPFLAPGSEPIWIDQWRVLEAERSYVAKQYGTDNCKPDNSKQVSDVWWLELYGGILEG